MADPAAPVLSPDVAAVFSAGGVPVVDAASAAGITVPPGIVPLARPVEALAPAPVPAVPVQPSPAAAVAAPQAPAADVAPAAPAAPAPTAALAVLSQTSTGGKARSRVIPLEWPIEFAGKLYTSITVRRPSSAEVGTFFERLAEGDPDNKVRYPIFCDDDGLPIPEEVWDALDDEDDERVAEGGNDFLPPRLRRLQAVLQSGSAPIDGASTEPTSSQS